MASIYLRGVAWYLKGRRNGARVWKSCGTSSKRVAEDFLRRFRRGEAVAELGIEAELRGQVGSQVQLGNQNQPLGTFAAQAVPGGAADLSIGELCDRWIAWCESYYVQESEDARRGDRALQGGLIGRDGRKVVHTGEVAACRAAVVPLRELFGDSPAALFGPVALKGVRERMIGLGWVRSSVNKQCGRVKRCFGWGVENELVPAGVLEGLRAVRGLRRGRSDAREAVGVGPVSDGDLKAVLGVAPRILGAMIMVQLLTAARPGEIVILRPCDFDCSGRVWVAVPSRFKSQYRGLAREIYFGPRAQEVIKPFMDSRGVHEFLFSPREAEIERCEGVKVRRCEGHSEWSSEVVSSEVASRESRRERDRLNYARRRGGVIKSRRPGDRYSVGSYRRAIGRICVELEISAWNPNQLRHNAGTEIRKVYGLEAAQVILGHRRADVTQVYAEANRAKAVALIEQIG
ncbi:MAG: tyrosine-type recombinase/integrase [Candidatus Hydrogenedentes bacterium]|nr:tyrosine-type recombinase/integrase [Candidatus Hydrogenedentota bacterium]